MKKLLIPFIILSLVSCAGSQWANTTSDSVRPIYVSPLTFLNLSCQDLEKEAASLIAKVPELETEIDKIKKDNDVYATTGAILFWPLLTLMKTNKDQAEELAQIKGTLTAIKEAAMRNECSGAGYISI